MTVKELDSEYVAHTYGRADAVLMQGKGAVVYDENGKKYIDLGSGIAVNTFGYADDVWQQAVIEQIGKLQHCSNLYYSQPCAVLASKICTKTGMKKVFFGNSGAEANECAIKTARKWAFDKYGDESHCTIITLKNSFHGRTIATLAATGQDALHTKFGPFPAGFVYADPTDASDVEKLASENACCAVMMELVQGEGGVCALKKDYVNKVVEIAKKHDMLIIIDEVQTGNGRTGTLYAFQQFGILPDIFTTAKGLAAGLPLGACVLGEKVENTLEPGTHGSTFGGNPVCCAAAVSVLDRIDDSFLNGVKERSDIIRNALKGAPGIEEITGLGLMIGLKTKKPVNDIKKECLEKGVIVLSAHNRTRLLPPLNIPVDQLLEGIEVLKQVLAE